MEGTSENKIFESRELNKELLLLSGKDVYVDDLFIYNDCAGHITVLILWPHFQDIPSITCIPTALEREPMNIAHLKRLDSSQPNDSSVGIQINASTAWVRRSNFACTNIFVSPVPHWAMGDGN